MTSICGASNADSSKYRPDIDGLRALAILPVALFHANLGCTGGFVGVDIFFVISGFLITSLLLKDLDTNTFSLLTFWERRIRRILPALSVVILATLVAGWFLYLPEDFVLVGQSIVSQVILISNVFFWRHTGYFDPGVDTKPLLHMWSLAVEEQFYVFFPLLIFLARFKRFSPARSFLWIGAASFALSVVGSYSRPSATFYMLPTRAWELMIGAFLAAIPGRKLSNPWINEAVGLSGLGLILYSISCYTRETRFPGLAAIPPCLGAALIIFSGGSGLTLTGRFLSLRPVVFIGVISYSLYLWHWPLLVFSKYLEMPGRNVKLHIVLLMASTALAFLSWRYVETPFRKRWICQTRPKIFTFAGVSMGMSLLLGLLVHYQAGFPARISTEALSYAKSRNHRAFHNNVTLEQAMSGQFVELGSQATTQPISVLIWGDSHAMAVTPILDDLCHRFFRRGIQATHSSTAPILEYVSPGFWSLKEDSPAFNRSVLTFISRNRVQKVIIAAAWNRYPASNSFKTGLVSTVRAIQDLGVRVYVLKDVPNPGFDVPRLVAATAMHNGDLEQLGLSREQFDISNRDLGQTFEQVAQMGATVLDPSNYFLNHKGVYGVVHNGQILYCDEQHLTVEGSRLLLPLFESIFRSE